MRTPGFGEANMGALAGAVVASVGGLFAVGIASAIVEQDPTLLFRTPLLSLISWLVCLPIGWLIGGQVGPRVGEQLRSQRAEMIAGGVSGLVPVALVAFWGWYMAVPH